MGYELQAIIAPYESVQRFMNKHDSNRFVELSQGFGMIPLDEETCLSIDESLNVSYMSLLSELPNECEDSTVNMLKELSGLGSAAILVIDCLGGRCHQRGIVFRNQRIVFDRYVFVGDTRPAEVLKKKTGFDFYVAKLFSKAVVEYVPNPDFVHSVAHFALIELGVMCDEKAFDAFDQLKLGRIRETEEWLSND